MPAAAWAPRCVRQMPSGAFAELLLCSAAQAALRPRPPPAGPGQWRGKRVPPLQVFAGGRWGGHLAGPCLGRGGGASAAAAGAEAAPLPLPPPSRWRPPRDLALAPVASARRLPLAALDRACPAGRTALPSWQLAGRGAGGCFSGACPVPAQAQVLMRRAPAPLPPAPCPAVRQVAGRPCFGAGGRGLAVHVGPPPVPSPACA